MNRWLATIALSTPIFALAMPVEAQLRTNPPGPAPLGAGAPPLMTTPTPSTPTNPSLSTVSPPPNAIGAPPLGAVGAPPVGAIGNTPTGAIAPPNAGMIGGTAAPNPTGPSRLAIPDPPPSVDLNQFGNRLP